VIGYSLADIHCQIRGHVQGVGYRAWLQREARKRGLRGWVRNCRDGSVEALFCGPRVEIEAMVTLVRRGPAGAKVENVTRQPAAAEHLAMMGSGFSVLRDAS
jgi:acylphosphatase